MGQRVVAGGLPPTDGEHTKQLSSASLKNSCSDPRCLEEEYHCDLQTAMAPIKAIHDFNPAVTIFWGAE